MINDIFLVRIRLRLPELFRVYRYRSQTAGDYDPGYLFHSILGETFGEMSPRLFFVNDNPETPGEILAYSRYPAQELEKKASAYAPPEIRDVVCWKDLSAKIMPGNFPPGHKLAFTVRVCPVVRKARGSSRLRPGSEVDIFLAEVERGGEESRICRQRLYLDWARNKLEHSGACAISLVELTRFRHARFLRRGRNRSFSTLTRPDVTCRGILKVSDSDRFRELMARGVGRHRAFGFGMLLLMPVKADA